jgi:hypothetical protein
MAQFLEPLDIGFNLFYLNLSVIHVFLQLFLLRVELSLDLSFFLKLILNCLGVGEQLLVV